MLELLNVAKVYQGGVRGVDDVTLRLGPRLLGLLRPNGAGKLSLMRVAATVTRPTSGQVLFEGADAVARPDPLRRNLGYLPQAPEVAKYAARAGRTIPVAVLEPLQARPVLRRTELMSSPTSVVGGRSGSARHPRSCGKSPEP